MSYPARNGNIYASDKWAEYRDEVKRRAYGNWDQILLALAGDTMAQAVGAGGKHVPCPKHGGSDGFRVFNDFRMTGGTVCNTCGSCKDGFATLHWLYGWTFSEAIRGVANVVGVADYRDNVQAPVAPKIQLVEPPKRKTREEVAREDEVKARRMAEAWSGSISIMDAAAAPARNYLRRRGITTAAGPLQDLRFHPGLPYFENGVNLGNLPVLLCLLRQPNGAPTTLQRIFITDEGDKASVEHVKKMMPYRSTVQYAGSAVRLDHNVGSVLCVAEGVETGLAFRAMLGLPTWSTCVAGLMEEVVVPDQVRVVIACGDLDLPTPGNEIGRGQAAAMKLVARCREADRRSAVLLPPFELPPGSTKGMDWLDVLNQYGVENARKQGFVSGIRVQIAGLLDSMGLSWDSAHAHF